MNKFQHRSVVPERIVMYNGLYDTDFGVWMQQRGWFILYDLGYQIVVNWVREFCANMHEINYNLVAKELTGKPVAWIGGDIAQHKLTESYRLLNIFIRHNVSPKVNNRVTKEDGYLLYCIGTERKVDLPLAVFRGMVKVHNASHNAALPFPGVISKLLVDMGKLAEPNEDIIIPKQKIDRFTLEKSKSHITAVKLDDSGEGDTAGPSGAGPSRVGHSVATDSDVGMSGDDQIGEVAIHALNERIGRLEVQVNEGFTEMR
ncbi:hypothetical protein MRB53_008111 [Persea americana]|uniref:Uncharacterized protein n=1 Tax=Persea americana TaxID=3435 RepID=A0ACC2MLV9_PERAE|nr:hypothetical protein MRB53_008111 [Persea americana]